MIKNDDSMIKQLEEIDKLRQAQETATTVTAVGISLCGVLAREYIDPTLFFTTAVITCGCSILACAGIHMIADIKEKQLMKRAKQLFKEFQNSKLSKNRKEITCLEFDQRLNLIFQKRQQLYWKRFLCRVIGVTGLTIAFAPSQDIYKILGGLLTWESSYLFSQIYLEKVKQSEFLTFETISRPVHPNQKTLERVRNTDF